MYIKRSFWYFSLEKYISDAEYDLLPQRLKTRYKRISIDGGSGPVVNWSDTHPPKIVSLRERANAALQPPPRPSGPIIRSTFVDDPADEIVGSWNADTLEGPSLLDVMIAEEMVEAMEAPVVVVEQAPVYTEEVSVDQFGGFEGGDGGGAGAGGSWDDNSSAGDDSSSYDSQEDSSSSYDNSNDDSSSYDSSNDYSSDSSDYSNNDF